MIEVCELFDVRYGVNLELNRMTLDPNGINFVSRTAKNNGVSAKVKYLPEVEPIEPGVLTVAGGGSVLETFLQPSRFYSGRDLYYLKAMVEMSPAQKLYYCACIRANKYRYNYGRQANRTLKQILIPSLDEIPHWVNEANPNMYENADLPAIQQSHVATFVLNTLIWKKYQLSELFTLRKGRRLTKANMVQGNVPFIGSIDSNNGVSAYVGQAAIHKGNTITVNYNGSVAEAFYQPEPFWASDDVNVLYPKFTMTPEVAMFVIAVIRQEKYRFNYGRKWHLERMRASTIKLPAKQRGGPDLDVMEQYIKMLPFSSQISNCL